MIVNNLMVVNKTVCAVLRLEVPWVFVSLSFSAVAAFHAFHLLFRASVIGRALALLPSVHPKGIEQFNPSSEPK